jgi:hypothetical protein
MGILSTSLASCPPTKHSTAYCLYCANEKVTDCNVNPRCPQESKFALVLNLQQRQIIQYLYIQEIRQWAFYSTCYSVMYYPSVFCGHCYMVFKYLNSNPSQRKETGAIICTLFDYRAWLFLCDRGVQHQS